MSPTAMDREILQAALVGYEMNRDQCIKRIAGIQKLLRAGVKVMPRTAKTSRKMDPAKTAKTATATPAKTRMLSAQGRLAIAAAQKRRWARVHAAKAAATPHAPKSRLRERIDARRKLGEAILSARSARQRLRQRESHGLRSSRRAQAARA